jgi:penicillin-binding protein 1C
MKGRWSEDVINDALTEPVYAQTVRSPLLAPLLAERMKRNAHGKTRVDTTIDAAMQSAVEGMLVDRARNLPPRVSIAAIVMDNVTLEVLAYAGSADLRTRIAERCGYGSIRRSPGSALKPFLYAFALDEGLISLRIAALGCPGRSVAMSRGIFSNRFMDRSVFPKLW